MPDFLHARRDFDQLLALVADERDTKFDDDKMRSAGILLELGFDDTAHNRPVTVSSWALDMARDRGVDVFDNRAVVDLLNNEAIPKMGRCRALYHAPSRIPGVQASRSWAAFGQRRPDIVVAPASTSHLSSGLNRRQHEGRT